MDLQAPRAWYDWLTQYPVSHGFTREQADQTLFIKRENGELIVAQVLMISSLGLQRMSLLMTFRSLCLSSR